MAVFILWILILTALYFFEEKIKINTNASNVQTATPESEHSVVPANLQRRNPKASIRLFFTMMLSRLTRFLRTTLASFATKNLAICFAIFFLKRIAFTSDTYIFQYASRILNWSLRKTAWIEFFHQLAVGIITGLLLPILNSLFNKMRHAGANVIDVSVIRGSILTAILGCLLVWRARDVVAMITGQYMLYACPLKLIVEAVFILGLAEGLEPTTQGLAASMVSSSVTGRLFATIAVVDQTAVAVSGPVIGGIFSASQNLDTGKQGLIYLVSSVRFQTSDRIQLLTVQVLFAFLFVFTLFF